MMVSKQNSTNVSFGPRRYQVYRTNTQYTVTRFHDDALVCTCPHFEHRIKTPVYDLKDGCKHMAPAINGEYGKPRVRASVGSRPTVRRVTVSAEMRDHIAQYDV